MSIFENAAMSALDYSKFNLSHEVKGTGKIGKLIPILCEEVLPGDIFENKTTALLRFMPLIAPMMHRVNVKFHFYYVPNRLVWNEWNDFIRGGNSGDEEIAPPMINLAPLGTNFVGKGTLYDYFGLPVEVNGQTIPNNTFVSALPFRAYNLIWNEFFRDQNLQDRIDFSLASGILSNAEAQKIMQLQKVAYEKDYFTSCLPFAQKGTEVTIPLLGTASGTILDKQVNYKANSGFQQFVQEDGTPFYENPTGNIEVFGYEANEVYIGLDGGAIHQANINPNGTLELSTDEVDVNLESASGISINDFREAVQTQKVFEKQARGGNRIQEWIWNFFGVRTSDQRLYLPEFLGGGQQPMQISEVMQQSGTVDLEGFVTPQGNLAGKGLSAGETNYWKKRFEEHGYIIGLMWISPRTAYQDGIDKKWLRADRFDYFLPEFQHLGEQEVTQREVFAFSNNPTATFGYQGRFNEYRQCMSKVVGDFRNSMSFWHMGRIFENDPQLNADFVTIDNESIKRPFAVVDGQEDEIQFMLYHELNATRKMAYHPTPGVHII